MERQPHTCRFALCEYHWVYKKYLGRALQICFVLVICEKGREAVKDEYKSLPYIFYFLHYSTTELNKLGEELQNHCPSGTGEKSVQLEEGNRTK